MGNRAMRRILEQSGCRPCGSARLYLVHAEMETGHVADFEALLAYLAAERYRVEILKPGEWARVPMAFGHHAAVLDVGWLRDAQLVQVLHAYPDLVPSAHTAQAIRAAGALNATLNVPGFIVDERARTVSHRLTLHLDERGGTGIYQLRRVLASVVAAASTYRAFWRDVILAPPAARPSRTICRRGGVSARRGRRHVPGRPRLVDGHGETLTQLILMLR